VFQCNRVLAVAFVLLWLPVSAHAADEIRALMDAGHWKRAAAAVDPLARTNPNDARTLDLESRLALAHGDAAAALAFAERAVAADAKNGDYRAQLANCVGTQAQHAGALKALGLAKRFRREAETALALDPRQLEAREGLIQFFSIAPGIAGGNDKKAAAMAETLVTLDRARGLMMQATLASRDKHDDRAEALLQQALAAGDTYAVRMALARFYAAEPRKRMDLAEQHARAARALDPGRVGGWTMLAHVFTRQQRWSALDSLLPEAEKNVPDNLTPYFQVGRTLIADAHDPARAERALRKYLTQESEPGSPSLAQAHWRLGQAIEKEGRMPEAIAEVQKAVEMDPSLDDAKKDLKRMKRA
jgi:tetratricopeptide (TPR) repeat protein